MMLMLRSPFSFCPVWSSSSPAVLLVPGVVRWVSQGSTGTIPKPGFHNQLHTVLLYMSGQLIRVINIYSFYLFTFF